MLQRIIPLLEREERQANQVSRLKGLDCEGENEPSHALIDRAFASFSLNQFKKIEWKDCHIRQGLLQAFMRPRAF